MNSEEIEEYKVQKIEKSSDYIKDSNNLRYFFDGLSAFMVVALALASANLFNALLVVGSYFSTALMYKKMRKDTMDNNSAVNAISNPIEFESYRVSRVEKCVKDRKVNKTRAIASSIVGACALGASVIGFLPVLPGVALFTAGLANAIDGYEHVKFAEGDLAVLNPQVVNEDNSTEPPTNSNEGQPTVNEGEGENTSGNEGPTTSTAVDEGGIPLTDSDNNSASDSMFSGDWLYSTVREFLNSNFADNPNASPEKVDELAFKLSKDIGEFYEANPTKLAEAMVDYYVNEAENSFVDDQDKGKTR